MPVKKSKINKKVKAEIKEAAEKIPGLIFEHVRLQTQHDEELKNEIEEKPKTVQTPINYVEMQKKRIILWAGVICLAIVVFAMWILNTGMLFSDLKNGFGKQVPGITETAKKSWEETATAMPEEKKVENLDDLKNKIKNNLQSLLIYAEQTSTTTSTPN
jgi:hypothetical protein